MGLSQQESMSLYGTPAYTGWGSVEAAGDAKNKGLSGGGNYGNSLLSQMGGSIDKYVQDLIDFANEDYNFAAKWIEDQYTKATGPDAEQRKTFLKSVASALEEKVGRIAFDYQTNKYRLQGKTDLALKRLAEDEAVMKEQANKLSAEERGTQNSALNARGIIAGTREGATGLAGKEIGNLESDINRRMSALERSVGRQREDITTANTQGLEDITTAARRSTIDAGSQYDYSLQNAQRVKDNAILKAEQQRKQMKDYLAAMEGAIT